MSDLNQKQPRVIPGSALDRISTGRGKAGGPDRRRPRGVQGANVGYWQAVGSSRAGAKRSKRP